MGLMRFCDVCERVMSRDPSSGRVVFSCLCGNEVPGGPEDARLGGAQQGASEMSEVYRTLIRRAAFDRVNQLVRLDCPVCNRDYLTQIRVGAAEVIIYRCRCGHEEVGGDRPEQPEGVAGPRPEQPEGVTSPLSEPLAAQLA